MRESSAYNIENYVKGKQELPAEQKLTSMVVEAYKARCCKSKCTIL